ncbi:hypothetical protein KM043_005941 [Ampulex compressa]|nr:hypothetical protein KM043_005941 [Ampulex compressa]
MNQKSNRSRSNPPCASTLPIFSLSLSPSRPLSLEFWNIVRPEPLRSQSQKKMSVVPLVFRNWWDDFERPISRIMDQHFGSGLHRDDLISGFSGLGLNRAPLRSIFENTYYRPWRNVARPTTSGSSTIQVEKDNFQVILDVQQFSPEEITVKTVGNNVIVEAKHEEKEDEHGFVSRHFVRRYLLPSTHDAINVTSSLSSDGVLTITAPRKCVTPAGTERVVDIVQTGEPAAKPVPVETTTEKESSWKTLNSPQLQRFETFLAADRATQHENPCTPVAPVDLAR